MMTAIAGRIRELHKKDEPMLERQLKPLASKVLYESSTHPKKSIEKRCFERQALLGERPS
jgi:hypothetical protein